MSSNNRVLILEYSPVDHAGIFRDFFAADGVKADTVQVQAGETVPPLSNYDLLWVMGGPQDTWQEDEFPWLVTQKAMLRDAVNEHDKPIMAFCLGAQLLADALGGEIAKMSRAEICLSEVSLTDAGRADPLFEDIDTPFKSLHWHGAEIKRLPEGCVSLAETPACATQAFRAGRCAYGIQFHMEFSAETVREWSDYGDYGEFLESAIGKDSVAQLDSGVREHGHQSCQLGRRVYDNFMRLVRV